MAPSSTLLIRRQLRAAAAAALAKKALDPVLLDLRALGCFSDYFCLCHGAGRQHLRTIADAVEEALEAGWRLRPSHRETGAEWIVLDYDGFMVHVFSAASRKFYDLERLWSKAKRIAVPADTGRD